MGADAGDDRGKLFPNGKELRREPVFLHQAHDDHATDVAGPEDSFESFGVQLRIVQPEFVETVTKFSRSLPATLNINGHGGMTGKGGRIEVGVKQGQRRLEGGGPGSPQLGHQMGHGGVLFIPKRTGGSKNAGTRLFRNLRIVPQCEGNGVFGKSHPRRNIAHGWSRIAHIHYCQVSRSFAIENGY